MDVQVLGDTPVQAYRFALGQFCFLVVGGHTLPVAGTGHSGGKKGQSYVSSPVAYQELSTIPALLY